MLSLPIHKSDPEQVYKYMFNRPHVARAVLQKNKFSHKVCQSVILCKNIFKTPSLQNRKSSRAEILGECSPSQTCNMSFAICHVLHVICHVACATYNMYQVTFFLKKKKYIFVLVKVAKLFCGGPVFNGANLSSFENHPIDNTNN